MKLDVKSLPTFATEAARIVTLRGHEPFNLLTLAEAEKVVKTWLYEALMELREPEESTVQYFPRSAAARELNIAPATLDDLIRKSVIKWRWLGNRKILLQADLNSLIKTENIYNHGKSKS